MPESSFPSLGVKHGWSERESGWGTGMEANLRLLDSLLQLRVLDKDLNTPPGTPADGDRYIVGLVPLDTWTGHTGEIALWNGTAWIFYVPKPGFLAYVEDEDLYYKRTAGGWVATAI